MQADWDFDSWYLRRVHLHVQPFSPFDCAELPCSITTETINGTVLGMCCCYSQAGQIRQIDGPVWRSSNPLPS